MKVLFDLSSIQEIRENEIGWLRNRNLDHVLGVRLSADSPDDHVFPTLIALSIFEVFLKSPENEMNEVEWKEYIPQWKVIATKGYVFVLNHFRNQRWSTILDEVSNTCTFLMNNCKIFNKQ